jgi:alkaline phosphatase
VIESGKALDDAVAVAREYARTHPDTLVIVGGDHECGGLTIEDAADAEDESGDGESAEDGPFTVAGSSHQIVADWSTTGHTGTDVPFTSEGPGAGALAGVVDNTQVYDAVAAALGVAGRRR